MRPIPLLCLLGLGAASPGSAAAQWDGPPRPPALTVDWRKPWLEGGDVSLPSSLLTLSLDWPLGERVTGIARLPLAHVGEDAAAGSESSTAIGNPFVGFRTANPAARGSIEAGVWLPLATDDLDALFFAALTDVPRFEAFLPDAWSASLRGRLETGPEEGLFTALGLGVLASFLDDDGQDESATYVDYGVSGGRRAGSGWIVAELGGRMLVSEDDVDFADRTVHELGVGGGWGSGRVQPSVRVRIPLDEDTRDYVKAVVGIGLRFRL